MISSKVMEKNGELQVLVGICTPSKLPGDSSEFDQVTLMHLFIWGVPHNSKERARVQEYIVT